MYNKIINVTFYTYLGTEKWDHSVEIKCRIEKAANTFMLMQSSFRSREMN